MMTYNLTQSQRELAYLLSVVEMHAAEITVPGHTLDMRDLVARVRANFIEPHIHAPVATASDFPSDSRRPVEPLMSGNRIRPTSKDGDT